MDWVRIALKKKTDKAQELMPLEQRPRRSRGRIFYALLGQGRIGGGIAL